MGRRGPARLPTNDCRYEIDVRNGTRATVIALDVEDHALGIRTDDGREVLLPADYLEHAHHGFAITGHISQGATTDRLAGQGVSLKGGYSSRMSAA